MKPIQKSRAGRIHIKCHRMVCTDLRLYFAGRTRCIRISGNRGHNDKLYLGCVHTCFLKSFSGCFCCHGSRSLFFCQMSGTDSGSFSDPFITGIYQRGKIIIICPECRQFIAGSHYFCIHSMPLNYFDYQTISCKE